MFLEKAENIRQDNSFLKAFVSCGTTQLNHVTHPAAIKTKKKNKKPPSDSDKHLR